MENKKKETINKIMETTEGGERQSPQQMKPTILPKNMMAVVGNTPVVLGQEYIVVKTVKKDSPTVSTGEIIGLNASMKSQTNPKSVQTNTYGSYTVNNGDSYHVASKPLSLLPNTSSLVKALVSQNIMKTSHSSSTEASLSQSQTLESVQTFPLGKKSLLFDHKRQCLSQRSLLADKSIVPECGNRGSTSSAYKLSTDQIVFVSTPKKTGTVIDLNSINANQSQKNASSKPHCVPSFIVNLPESSGNQGSASTPQIGDNNTKYYKMTQLPQGNTIRKIMPGISPASHVQNTLKLVGPQGPAILSKGGQSMVIGNIASLSPITTSQLPSAIIQNIKEPSGALRKKGSYTVPIHPGRSLLSVPRPMFNTSVKQFSPQSCSTLKSILSLSSSSYTNPSMLRYSLQPTGFPLLSSSNVSTDGGKATPIQNAIRVEDDDPDIKQSCNDIIDYYTSVESCDKGQQVMVMRPRLESDIDSNETSVAGFQGRDTTGKLILSQISGNQSLTSSFKGGDAVKDDKQCNDAPLNLKIQSVFSLAHSVPDFESSNYDDTMEDESETEICHLSDTDTACEDFETDPENEQETTFNIHENKWKKTCPMSFVVLERLTHQDIEDKRAGRTKHSVRCSQHCRLRTLSYMCGLNLLHCENPSILKDITSYMKTDIYKSMSTVDDKEIKEIDSETVRKPAGVTKSPTYVNNSEKAKKPAETTKSSSCLKKDGDDKEVKENDSDDGNNKENNKCKQPAQLCKDKNQKETSELKIESCQTLEGETGILCKETLIASEIKSNLHTETSSLAKTEILSDILVTDKDEGEQLKEDLVSLKARIEEKRLKMKLEKAQRNLFTETSGAMKNTPLAPFKAQSNQSFENMPAMPGNLKKSQEKGLPQKNPVNLLKTNASQSASTTKEHQILKESPTVPTSSRAIPAFYVMDCSAKSLFNHFKTREGSQSAGERFPIASPLTLKKTQPTTLPHGNSKIALSTVFSTLKSLADHFKAIGHVPTGSQYVMTKSNNTPLLLKICPADLFPENLDALKKASQLHSSQPKEQQTTVSLPSAAKPHQITSASKSKPDSQQTRQPQRPSSPIYLSFAEAVAHKEKVSSPKCKKSSPSHKLPIKTKSLTSPFHRGSSSSSPKTSTSPSQSILSNEKKQSTNVPYGVVTSTTNKTSSSTSNSSLCSLLTTDQSVSKNIANLSHFPMSSSLLPERRLKRPTGVLSEEERDNKRRRLEQKYPLPPGVIIKSEPDTSEYELDSNWSVTSYIQTDYLNSPEMAEMETDDCPMIVNNVSGRGPMILDENQQNGSSTEEVVDDAGSPPHLDSCQSCQVDEQSGMSPSAIEIEDDEEPPVLQPMTFTSFQQTTSEADKALNRMSAAQVYDSGYDSVCPSSSNESIESQQTLSKQPFTKMSKIQQLKELLKVKQLQVENMLKKRSELPEVDLNAM